MNLTPHFTLEELTHSDVAVRKGIDNTPNVDVIENLRSLALALEQVRELLGVPMYVSSGYRSLRTNAAVGGASTSAHVQGLAADFTAPAFGTPIAVCEAISESGIGFDQLIYEGAWVHLSVDPRHRQQVLTARFAGGRVSYLPGLVA